MEGCARIGSESQEESARGVFDFHLFNWKRGEKITAHGSLEDASLAQDRRVAAHTRRASQGEVLTGGVEVVVHLAGDVRADSAQVHGSSYGAG